MYNELFGQQLLAKTLLHVLDLTPETIERFRDCYLNKVDGEIVIIVFTRLGGGNRADYQHVYDKLARHPNYLRDYDDTFDSTYSYIEFSVPELFKCFIKEAAQVSLDYKPMERYLNMITDLDNKKDTPDTKKALEIGKKIAEQIKAAEASGGGVKIIEI